MGSSTKICNVTALGMRMSQLGVITALHVLSPNAKQVHAGMDTFRI